MTRKKASRHSQASDLGRLSDFPLLKALTGRRSRRFPLGGEIPSGPFAYTSAHAPMPLSELERAIVLSAMIGNTGWHHAIPFNQAYAPKLPNYAAAAGGRVFPSAAGFHTTDLFFTDDNGTYFLSTRDSGSLRSPLKHHGEGGAGSSLESWLEVHRQRIQKISPQRLEIPREEPHMDGHNHWIANTPGSLFAFPVADLAQHFVLILCYLVQNGHCIYDDINGTRIPGIESFQHFVDIANPYPLTFVEQTTLGEATVEIATSCFSGALVLQAMGLGGWMYDGIDRHAVFGVTGDPRSPGLGFQFATDDRWSLPNPLGLPGIFEAYCPPYFADMRAAVEAVVQRKFGVGGPFHRETPGPWKDSAKIRASADVHSEEFISCVTAQAQFILDSYGKVPATLPSVYCLTYLQAQHIDLDFYDRYYEPGAYLDTHESHMRDWHEV